MTKTKDIQVIREAITKVVSMLTRKSITVTQQGQRAFVEYHPVTKAIKRVNVPYLPDDASDEFIAAVQGFLDHEVGHVLYSDPNETIAAKRNPVTEEDRSQARLANLANIIEDVFIERKMGEAFAGSEYNLENTRKFYLERIARKNIKDRLAQGDMKGAAGAATVAAFRAWGGQKAAQDFIKDPAIADLIKPIADKLGQDLIDRIRKCNSSRDCNELAKLMKGKLEEPQQPQPPQPPQPQPQQPPQDPQPNEPDDDQDDQDNDQQPQQSDAGQDQGDTQQDNAGSTQQPNPQDDAGDEQDDHGQQPQDNAGAEPQDEPQGDPQDDTGNEPEPEPGEPGDEPQQGNPSQGDGNDEEDDDTQDAGDSGRQQQGDADADDEQGGTQPDSADDEPDGDDDTDGPQASAGEQEPQDQDGDEPQDQGDAPSGNGDDTGDQDDGAGQQMQPGTAEPADAEPDTSLTEMFDEERDFDKDMGQELTQMAAKEIAAASYRIFTTEFDEIEEAPKAQDPKSAEKMVQEANATVGVMQKYLERAMAAQSRKGYNPGQRKGKINPGSLFKASAGDDRVFRKRYEIKAKDTAVTLLVDNSGSMHMGGKIRVAGFSAYALARTLERLRIPCEVLGFTTKESSALYSAMAAEGINVWGGSRRDFPYARNRAIYMPVFKTFNERLTTEVESRFASMQEPEFGALMENNIDGESVQVAAYRLLKQRADRHVLIVLSDGQPNCDGAGAGLAQHLRKVVKELPERGVEVIGIGIMDQNVASFYPKHVVLNNVRELPTTLIGQLTKLLLQ